MTILDNTFLSFSAIGNREDIQDKIFNIAPVDVPFQNLAAKGKCTNRVHSWQTSRAHARAKDSRRPKRPASFSH